MAQKPTTSRSEIEAYLAKGLTEAEVARVLGITRSGVNWHLRQSGGQPYETAVARAKKLVPWAITGDAVNALPYRAILSHLEYQETRGHGMSAEKLRKLRGFYQKLDSFSMVVRYDPEIPPRPGQKYGQFEYVPRTEADNLIVREDEHTTIPAGDRDLWELPSREDWPQ